MQSHYNTTKTKLISLPSWQDKYREIMLLGKTLPLLPNELKVDNAKVNGCESNVWLYLSLDETETTLLVVSDSDTRIVKGLIALIVNCFNGLTPAQALEVNISEEFEQMGLLKHLSPSRGNGIKAIVAMIQQYCENY
ncbi:SufE family protein [Pseudoalteromonas tunicata]|jgi:cysteine desulfuration protein SufE|uniref:Putative SufE protein n=1 Tax=Pseudoalteromonas tunicata D2 TaxID=87626 RepID=A4CCA5_9GAMM|nr:SufE family protein [Pseudoalteromonas tunicata]ATC94540.1 cysteine desulfuration protein SufE [Pseudoalteromonas tunicata]AXT30267.1 SufE family protein [Pseudoalteromonas tunicata]EAR27992.1 putative SufE protein [Pseudoalteromonas tunicata D2]